MLGAGTREMAPQRDAQAAPPEGPGESSSGPGDPILFSVLGGHSTHRYTDTFRQTPVHIK